MLLISVKWAVCFVVIGNQTQQRTWEHTHPEVFIFLPSHFPFPTIDKQQDENAPERFLVPHQRFAQGQVLSLNAIGDIEFDSDPNEPDYFEASSDPFQDDEEFEETDEEDADDFSAYQPQQVDEASSSQSSSSSQPSSSSQSSSSSPSSSSTASGESRHLLGLLSDNRTLFDLIFVVGKFLVFVLQVVFS